MKEMTIVAHLGETPVVYAPATMKAVGLGISMATTLTPADGSAPYPIICVDASFAGMCAGAKKFFLWHEMGHIVHGDLESPELAADPVSSHLTTGDVHPMEEAADKFAMEHCSDAELSTAMGALIGMWIWSWKRPGLKDLKPRAKAIKEELRRRKKAKRLAESLG